MSKTLNVLTHTAFCALASLLTVHNTWGACPVGTAFMNHSTNMNAFPTRPGYWHWCIMFILNSNTAQFLTLPVAATNNSGHDADDYQVKKISVLTRVALDTLTFCADVMREITLSKARTFWLTAPNTSIYMGGETWP